MGRDTHAIKLRPAGTKSPFAFLSGQGGQNRLRVHALRYPSRQAALDEIERFRFWHDQSNWEYKVVKL